MVFEYVIEAEFEELSKALPNEEDGTAVDLNHSPGLLAHVHAS
jgi:hypothetical protein